MSTQRPSMSLHVTWPSPVLVLQATTAGVRRPGYKDSKMSKPSLENTMTFSKKPIVYVNLRRYLKSAAVVSLHLLYMQCTSNVGAADMCAQ